MSDGHGSEMHRSSAWPTPFRDAVSRASRFRLYHVNEASGSCAAAIAINQATAAEQADGSRSGTARLE